MLKFFTFFVFQTNNRHPNNPTPPAPKHKPTSPGARAWVGLCTSCQIMCVRFRFRGLLPTDLGDGPRIFSFCANHSNRFETQTRDVRSRSIECQSVCQSVREDLHDDCWEWFQNDTACASLFCVCSRVRVHTCVLFGACVIVCVGDVFCVVFLS